MTPVTRGKLRPVILIVDDEPGVRASVKIVLEPDYEVVEAVDGRSALAAARARRVDLCLLDIRLPDTEGTEVLARLKALDGGLEVVLVTAVRAVQTAVLAMRLGAHDYLTKPFAVEDLRGIVRRALERRALRREVRYLRSELARQGGFDGLVGSSPAMQRVYAVIRAVASTTATVLVAGESGTGKELIARAIHRQGTRREAPFVAVNCGALPGELTESELFGHERGAFTGAHARRAGRVEIADGGTLFLDEIATLRLDLQPKLLRVLQEREVEPVGGSRTRKVDVRFIAATNTDLRREVSAGRFREDLFYRLHVVPIVVPPLRERPEDVAPLARHFLDRYASQFGRAVREISPGARSLLERYHWPGNVRELENVIARSVALASDKVVQLDHLPLDLALGPAHAGSGRPPTLREARQEFERQVILRALDRAGGNQTIAARDLGMHRNTLWTKLAQLGLRVADGQDEPPAGSEPNGNGSG